MILHYVIGAGMAACFYAIGWFMGVAWSHRGPLRAALRAVTREAREESAPVIWRDRESEREIKPYMQARGGDA